MYAKRIHIVISSSNITSLTNQFWTPNFNENLAKVVT